MMRGCRAQVDTQEPQPRRSPALQAALASLGNKSRSLTHLGKGRARTEEGVVMTDDNSNKERAISSEL